MSISIGENLPYQDNSFDCVSTFQTLEHVQNVKKCLLELVRVTKTGGGIHIRCPDYRSTYEGHYYLPWLPCFPRKTAKIYLKILKRPTLGLDTIQYVTLPKIKRILNEINLKTNKRLNVIDLNKNYFESELNNRGIPFMIRNFLPS